MNSNFFLLNRYFFGFFREHTIPHSATLFSKNLNCFILTHSLSLILFEYISRCHLFDLYQQSHMVRPKLLKLFFLWILFIITKFLIWKLNWSSFNKFLFDNVNAFSLIFFLFLINLNRVDVNEYWIYINRIFFISYPNRGASYRSPKSNIIVFAAIIKSSTKSNFFVNSN